MGLEVGYITKDGIRAGEGRREPARIPTSRVDLVGATLVVPGGHDRE